MFLTLASLAQQLPHLSLPWLELQTAPMDLCLSVSLSLSQSVTHMWDTCCKKLAQPFPRRQILDSSKLKELADNNFIFCKKCQKVLQKGRKHCGKRINCSLRAISPFLTVFTKELHTCKNQGLFGKGLNFYQMTNSLTGPNWKHLQATWCNLKTKLLFWMGRKHCEKWRKCWLPAFSPFLTIFSKGFFFMVVTSRAYLILS